ncbi:hypothetical protein [Sedimentitalea todarodis]|uniref:NTP pyrophosphohydrolase MazG putative catalytic core domain-containing protein n=1 Tax=Sedimentitalea todarodis TaxID=1631240 RepID=A0ABU3VDX9_9RHOB|nr:hypothetical protein [Sedimentitalea todarodis]MDU9003929.1 hypothetical protein [Sedimentitalea todarodis]
MTDDDKVEIEDAITQGFDGKIIEELYRLAEIVQSTEGNGDSERKRIAAERMADILQTSVAANPPRPKRNAEHRWILDVLLDLVQYAETYDLEDVDKILNDARFKTTQILNRK